MKAVPYQLCPKCNGDKEVLVQKWNGGTSAISSGMHTCDICNGEGIIPMHLIEEITCVNPIDFNFLNDVVPDILTFESFKDTFKEEFSDSTGCDVEDMTDDANIRDDLGADSLDVYQFIVRFERNLNFTIPEDLIEILDTFPLEEIIKKLYALYQR